MRKLFVGIIFTFLSGCIYSVTSDRQIIAVEDLDPITQTEWRVLTAVFGNVPDGRSTVVEDDGKVRVTEMAFGSATITVFENGEPVETISVELATDRTALFTFEEGDAGEENCTFGVTRLSETQFILPTIGPCEGKFENFFAMVTADEDTNGYTFASFDNDAAELVKVEALAAVHGIDVSVGGAITISGDVTQDVFRQFIADAFSAELLR